MSTIVARSRIGFWSAFMHDGRPVLNARDPGTGLPVTVPLEDEECSVLVSGHEPAHLLVSGLLGWTDRRMPISVPTPVRSCSEGVDYDWTTAPRARPSEEART